MAGPASFGLEIGRALERFAYQRMVGPEGVTQLRRTLAYTSRSRQQLTRVGPRGSLGRVNGAVWGRICHRQHRIQPVRAWPERALVDGISAPGATRLAEVDGNRTRL